VPLYLGVLAPSGLFATTIKQADNARHDDQTGSARHDDQAGRQTLGVTIKQADDVPHDDQTS